MIYDELKKDLYHKYMQIIEKEAYIQCKYKKFLTEKQDDDVQQFLAKIPQGFTYRSVKEYKELIEKIFRDLKNQYLLSLDLEERKSVIQQMEDILSEINDIERKSDSAQHNDDLNLKIQANMILKKATSLFGSVRKQVLEKIKFRTHTEFSHDKMTTKEKSSSKVKSQRNKQKRKRGVEDLLKKIYNVQKDGEDETSKPQSQTQDRKSIEKTVNLHSLEKFLIDNQSDLIPELFDAALLAIQTAKENPTPENIVQAKYAVQRALDET